MVLYNLLTEAREARLTDNYDAAIALCSAYLVAHPNDPEGESLLGLCELETNRPGGAERIEAAAARKPESYSILLNLSILRELRGDIRRAIRSANAAAQKAPAVFECWAQLGKLLGKVEKFEEAAAALEQALKIKPGHTGVRSLLAVAALECDDFDRCEEALTEIEKTAPKSETVRMRAHLARKRGRWTDLQMIANDWLRLDPTCEEARLGLAHALAQQGYFNEAALAYAPLCDVKQPESRHIAAMGRYLLGGRRLKEARGWFENALASDPKCAEAAYGLARLNHFSGDVANAEKWCRQTLALEPSHADAFALLAEFAKGPDAEKDLDAINAALAARRLRRPEKISLLFAKGDFLHALNRTDEAFDAWSAANELKSAHAHMSGADYDPAAQEGRTSSLIRIFPGEGPPLEDAGGGATPIFIVGMPRSGTTLLESAITAHPDVDAAGEVPAMPYILNEFLDLTENSAWTGGDIPENKRNEWRELYLRQARRFGAKDARFFTDKQPSNVMGVGLIARLFPNARFIYLRRNPVETSFSIFRRNFTSQWSFSTRLSSIAHYYAEHCRIADHWLSTMPGRLKFVQYEDLVRRFEPTLREVVEFCGLKWNDRCLSFHEVDRAVITFSAAQVRKPPSAAHLNSTAPYAARLAELTEALKALGVDLETGARSKADDKNGMQGG